MGCTVVSGGSLGVLWGGFWGPGRPKLGPREPKSEPKWVPRRSKMASRGSKSDPREGKRGADELRTTQTHAKPCGTHLRHSSYTCTSASLQPSARAERVCRVQRNRVTLRVRPKVRTCSPPARGERVCIGPGAHARACFAPGTPDVCTQTYLSGRWRTSGPGLSRPRTRDERLQRMKSNACGSKRTTASHMKLFLECPANQVTVLGFASGSAAGGRRPSESADPDGPACGCVVKKEKSSC